MEPVKYIIREVNQLRPNPCFAQSNVKLLGKCIKYRVEIDGLCTNNRTFSEIAHPC